MHAAPGIGSVVSFSTFSIFVEATRPFSRFRLSAGLAATTGSEDETRQSCLSKRVLTMRETIEKTDCFTSRRDFLRQAASGVLLFLNAPAFAEELLLTPQLTEEPYYPDRLPLDTDNDPIVISPLPADSSTGGAERLLS
jgi:hypothetical protein